MLSDVGMKYFPLPGGGGGGVMIGTWGRVLLRGMSENVITLDITLGSGLAKGGV